jgi:hypothetical protein
MRRLSSSAVPSAISLAWSRRRSGRRARRPHRGARVEAGRRLVEEDDPRVADESHREVEPAPHAAGVRGGGPPGRLDQVEAVEQLGGAAATLGPAEPVQVGHQDQVLLAR